MGWGLPNKRREKVVGKKIDWYDMEFWVCILIENIIHIEGACAS